MALLSPRLCQDQTGAALSEYSVLIALISATTIGFIVAIAGDSSNFQNVYASWQELYWSWEQACMPWLANCN